ncbi:MAG: helix-turn-helix transcriptional regulator, partial [Ruminococcaceae bacterium]|nr:helix-turn-helix transcriptional regulator [Oscillospiraceae bacterium]
MNIGKKIKDIRRQKRITQAELAKDVITRNMLSQIENGKATPSIPTLVHIANVLEIPVEYLISENENLFDFTKKAFVEKLKKAYAAKKYSDCIYIWESSQNQADDEISLIMAHSYLEY